MTIKTVERTYELIVCAFGLTRGWVSYGLRTWFPLLVVVPVILCHSRSRPHRRRAAWLGATYLVSHCGGCGQTTCHFIFLWSDVDMEVWPETR
jgi:hypothetical protein